MARRGNYSHRETRKTKKDEKKIPRVTITTTPANVEVVGKKRKKREEEEEA